ASVGGERVTNEDPKQIQQLSLAANCPQFSIEKDYVATRWYKAPELCGSLFSK
ncbi:uncharacterized protein A4U43_C01F34050, partial [Asparagus officinalis]